MITMNNSIKILLNTIKENVQKGLPNVMSILAVDTNDPDAKEKHAEILMSGWQTIKDQFINKWIPEMSFETEEDIITYLKQEKSIHSIYDYVKKVYRDAILISLDLDSHHIIKVDPDTFDKIKELSFEANVAYHTLLSIMNEQLEIFLALADDDDSEVREKAEDLWLNEVYERVMIEYIQYGKNVVQELDDYARSIDYFDGFDKDLLHDIYIELFNDKMKEIKMVREIIKTA
jgi:hypothetical protein